MGIMVGPSDKEAPAQECAVWLANKIRDCELMLLEPEAGHYVFLCEATEAGRHAQPEICWTRQVSIGPLFTTVQSRPQHDCF